MDVVWAFGIIGSAIFGFSAYLMFCEREWVLFWISIFGVLTGVIAPAVFIFLSG